MLRVCFQWWIEGRQTCDIKTVSSLGWGSCLPFRRVKERHDPSMLPLTETLIWRG